MKNVYPDVDYGRDLTKNITPNFKYGEFVASETAMKYGIKKSKKKTKNFCISHF